jgi:ketosteroid isomerase-like protein
MRLNIITQLLLPLALLLSCTTTVKTPDLKQPPTVDLANEKAQITTMLDNFNAAAANADYDGYFGLYTEDAVFIGTDATENWDMSSFKEYARSAFETPPAWAFTALDRNIYVDESGKIAWFDELLDTRFKIARGSGVLKKVDDQWKVQHYVLSITVPNDSIDAVITIKAPIEDALIQKLKGN